MAETITALGTLVAAVGALIVSVRNSRKAEDARVKAAIAAEAAASAKAEIILTKEGVFEVGKQIDGRLSELLKLTRESALAEGRLEGAAGMTADAGSQP